MTTELKTQPIAATFVVSPLSAQGSLLTGPATRGRLLISRPLKVSPGASWIVLSDCRRKSYPTASAR